MLLKFQEGRENSFFAMTDVSGSDRMSLLSDPSLYKIIWMRKGMSRLVVDSIQYDLDANQIAFLTPHNMVDQLSESGDFVIFLFNREFYCIREHDQQVSCHGYLFYGSSSTPIIQLTEVESKRFTHLFDIFQEEFDLKDRVQGEMLRTLLQQLLIKSSRIGKRLMINPGIEQAKLDVIRKYNVLVEQNYRKLHRVKDYAELLLKSPKTLSNLFAQYNDQSPLGVINERIVLEAKRLLSYSDMTVDEISYELGYKEAPHFSKFFKKHSGISPSDFRKQAQLT